MRDTLIIGLLLAMPVAVILASAALALLAGTLRRRLQAHNDGPQTADMTQDFPLVIGPGQEVAAKMAAGASAFGPTVRAGGRESVRTAGAAVRCTGAGQR